VLKRDLRAPAVLAMLTLAGCSASSGTPVTTTAPAIATTAGAAGGPALRVRDVLSPAQLSWPNFQVADEVNNDGFLNYYTVHVRQPEAMLEVAGTELLLVRLDELDAVAKLLPYPAGHLRCLACREAPRAHGRGMSPGAVGPYRPGMTPNSWMVGWLRRLGVGGAERHTKPLPPLPVKQTRCQAPVALRLELAGS
jgi:hypothetical protein